MVYYGDFKEFKVGAKFQARGFDEIVRSFEIAAIKKSDFVAKRDDGVYFKGGRIFTNSFMMGNDNA